MKCTAKGDEILVEAGTITVSIALGRATKENPDQDKEEVLKS